MPVIAVAVGAVVAVIVLIILFKMVWRVAEPNEALIISGLGARSKPIDGVDSLGFKIITGKGTAVLPGFQTSRRLRLDSRAANLEVSCVTQQGIPVKVRGVVIYKVGDDFVSIANAARRFLEQQKSMDGAIHELFTGHLRSIIGNLTVEDLILNRERLTSETRGSAADEMSKLGLIVDSLQIQEIHDDAGYITNLGRPHAAKVAAAARIAEAERNQEATQREQEALRENAAVIRDTEIKKAEYEGQVQQAAQQARQEVILKETRNAELEAERTEKRLESEVRKPADARAYEQVKLAEAEREERISYAQAAATEVQLKAQRESEAIRLLGEAEADATRQKGLAEAEAIKARAVALAENTDAVIAQQLAEKWPEIVEAGAGVFGNVDNMVLLNGAQGMEDMLAKALTLGGTGLGVARQLLAGMNGQNAANGHNGVPAATVPVEVPAETPKED
ncbi:MULTISPECIES: SPFH domain-containing protein [Actinomadura]|uniref:Flotillin n=1 Tax=Actinomadura madurae TaxID=1993 RepID=A0A1I5LZB6_9ACTN|nr:flotillin family protein [Actinomadura madurae]URM97315.1 SPFH domain-containing protein [Actinomadura madurae]URN08080.1 SPFH domain-containing protein [Actinomadura madurae]SFP02625.1 Flotillin [Actinomadura madurae]SPT52265.1 Inner membrane protein yqiK [Actinomadura madurae]